MATLGKKPGWATHLRARYRSGLELAVAALLLSWGVAAQYEQVKVPYTVPASKHTYTPDWVCPNGVVLETKGLWDAADRKKIALVKEQHPDLDLRMVFTNPAAKISKGSKTTYAMVCERMGIPYSKKEPPREWTQEPSNARSLEALHTLGYRTSS